MIERMDLEQACVNETARHFRQEHLDRYAFATRFLETMGRSDLRIIDAASGTGYGSTFLSRFGAYTGLDVSSEAIAESRKRHPRARFEQRDLNDPQAFKGF